MELHIDCRNDLSLIHEQLAQHLPEWYGRNLDALYDCLTSLTQPVTVTLQEPDLLPKLAAVVRDAALENPNLTICVQ